MEATKAPAVSPDPISPKLATVLVSVPPAPIDCAIENNPPLTVEAVCIEAAAEPAATPENYILENFCIKITKKLKVLYLNNVQVSNFGEKCAGKFYLHKAIPAHCSGKFTYILFSVWSITFSTISCKCNQAKFCPLFFDEQNIFSGPFCLYY